MRIAEAVPALVVVEDVRQRGLEILEALDEAGSGNRVAPDLLDSSPVSAPGLQSTLASTAILPTSWSEPPRWSASSRGASRAAERATRRTPSRGSSGPSGTGHGLRARRRKWRAASHSPPLSRAAFGSPRRNRAAVEFALREVAVEEAGAGERRVALVPDSVRLMAAGFTVAVERRPVRRPGSRTPGIRGGRRRGRRRGELLSGANAVVRVAAPAADEVASSHGEPFSSASSPPLTDPAASRLAERGIVAFAMESIPRITRPVDGRALFPEHRCGLQGGRARRRPLARLFPC